MYPAIGLATSAARTFACSSRAETKVVERGLPFPIHYRSLHKVGTIDGEGKVPAPPSGKATAATPRIYVTRQSGFVFMGQFRILRTRTSVKLEAILV
jgi:hypothetical protein